MSTDTTKLSTYSMIWAQKAKVGRSQFNPIFARLEGVPSHVTRPIMHYDGTNVGAYSIGVDYTWSRFHGCGIGRGADLDDFYPLWFSLTEEFVPVMPGKKTVWSRAKQAPLVVPEGAKDDDYSAHELADVIDRFKLRALRMSDQDGREAKVQYEFSWVPRDSASF